jgi:hypothetical protein
LAEALDKPVISMADFSLDRFVVGHLGSVRIQFITHTLQTTTQTGGGHEADTINADLLAFN